VQMKPNAVRVPKFSRQWCGIATLVVLSSILTGCFHLRDRWKDSANKPVDEKVSGSNRSSGDALPVTLAAGGLAIITPTAGNDQQEDRQTLALVFSNLLAKRRSDLHVIPLAQTLSAVNSAGLAHTYDQMYTTYRDSGLFDIDPLQKIGRAVGVRYLAQLKVGSFNQNDKGGIAPFLGIALTHKETANVRLFVQLWDSATGKIVWERSSEASKSTRSLRDKPISIETVINSASEDLITTLPR